MTNFCTYINKGDLILVSHRDKQVFDGVVGMVAKRDIESKSHAHDSIVGSPQGDGQCILVSMEDFEALGDFYGLTRVSTSYNECIAMVHPHLIVPDDCNWVVKNASVSW